jgi:hypothetical protein
VVADHFRGTADGVKGVPRSSPTRLSPGHASDVGQRPAGRRARLPCLDRFLHAVLDLDSSRRHGELIKKLLTATAPGRLGDDDVDGDGDDGRSFFAGCAGRHACVCASVSVCMVKPTELARWSDAEFNVYYDDGAADATPTCTRTYTRGRSLTHVYTHTPRI